MTTHQPNLFGPPNVFGDFQGPPLARISDPTTSHRAAARQQANGRADSQADTIVAILRRVARPMTFREIWASATDAERDHLREAVTIARRLTNMERRGLVVAGRERTCTVSGSAAREWTLAE